MEVAVPVPVAMGGKFHFVSAPSSPANFAATCYSYASAPSSPSSAFVPFDWESKPGTPKHNLVGGSIAERRGGDEDDDDMEFAFEFRCRVVPGGWGDAATADELFEAGKIRPLKLPPRLQQFSPNLGAVENCLPTASPKLAAATIPKFPISRLFRRGKKESEEGEKLDPFEKAIEETTRGRERERWLRGSVQGSRNAAAWSALADRVAAPAASSGTANTPKEKGGDGAGRRWKLRYLLLFRSASDGRKDAPRDCSGRRVGPSDMTKKKTFPRYRKGLLGRLGLGPDVHGLFKGFGSLVHGRS